MFLFEKDSLEEYIVLTKKISYLLVYVSSSNFRNHQSAMMASSNLISPLLPEGVFITFEPSQPTGQKIVVLHKEPSGEEEYAAFLSWIEEG